MSRVDVVIPCYNYAHFLPDCVESVLNQPVAVRVLIIDDASQDNTPEVGQALAEKDSRVEYRRHAVNRGHIATYNEGLLEWASADYSLLISADDLLTPCALARAVRFFDAHPQAGLVYGGAIKFSTGERLPSPSTVSEECQARLYTGNDWLRLVCEDADNPIYSPEAVVRTRLQQELGGYNPDLPHAGDLEMWLRFAANADVGVLDADQAFYRIHQKNMHLMHYRGIGDCEQRKAAYDAVFRRFGHKIRDAASLQDLSLKNLAWNAVWDARRAVFQGELGYGHDLLVFAVDTYPRARWWRAYLRTNLMLRMARTIKPALKRLGTAKAASL